MASNPLDPPDQHKAARILGRMDADGLLPPGEASKTMAAIVKVAFKAAPHVDRSGLRARLVWSAADAKKSREQERLNAMMAVRWAARPIIIANAPPERALDAARKAAGDMLTEKEILPILADEWNRAHGRRGRK